VTKAIVFLVLAFSVVFAQRKELRQN